MVSISDFMFPTFLTYVQRLGTLKPAWAGLLPNLPNLPHLFPTHTCAGVRTRVRVRAHTSFNYRLGRLGRLGRTSRYAALEVPNLLPTFPTSSWDRGNG